MDAEEKVAGLTQDQYARILNLAIWGLAQSAGWRVTAASFYDEEGIEGWRWNDPRYTEYTEIGEWSEPPAVPPDVRAIFLGKAKALVAHIIPAPPTNEDSQ